jgi:hypothetical protein
MKTDNQEIDNVDISEPLNFAYIFLLLDQLAKKYLTRKEINAFPPSNDSDFRSPESILSWNPGKFVTRKNRLFEKLKEIEEKKPNENNNNLIKKFKNSFESLESLDKYYYQFILARLQKKFNTYYNRNLISIEPVLNALCFSISIDLTTEGILSLSEYYNWENFRKYFKNDAELFLKDNLDYCSEFEKYLSNLEKKSTIKIIYSLYEKGTDKEKHSNLKKEINESIKSNIKALKNPEDKLSIDIKVIETRVKNIEQAKKLLKEKDADILIYGVFSGENDDNIRFKLDYKIGNKEFLNRISKYSKELNKNSKSTESQKTSLFEIEEGQFQGEIQHSMILLLAISNYLRREIELAIKYLKKIPKKDRVSEVWFMLGVCFYERGELEKASKRWLTAHDMGNIKASVNLALLIESAYKNSRQNEEKSLFKNKIMELLPMNKLNSASADVQFKAAVIFEHLFEDLLAIDLYQLVLEDKKSSYFKDASLFLAMMAGEINQIQEILKKECSLDLKKAATFYLLKSQRLETDQKNDLSLQLLNNLDMEDPETERFYADIIQLISIEKLRLNGFKSKSIDSMPNDIEVKSSSHSLDPDDILGEKTLSEGSVDSIKNSIEAPSEKKKERILYWLENHFQNYLTGLRSTSPNKSYFLFDMHFIRKTKLKEYTTIRLYLSEIDDFLELTKDADGMFPVSREQLEDFYLEEIPEKLAVKVFHPDPNGHFLDSEITINLAIPNLGTLRDEIEQLTLFVPYQNAEEYYKAIRNYLEEFYGSVDPFDMNDWLCDVGLAYEDVRIFINA